MLSVSSFIRGFSSQKFIVSVLMLMVTLSLSGCQTANSVTDHVDKKISAKVVQVLKSNDTIVDNVPNTVQLLEVRIVDGENVNDIVNAESDNSFVAGQRRYVAGDDVFLVTKTSTSGKVTFAVYDYNRLSPLFWLFILFVVLTVLIARKRGVASFIGMACSFLIIFYFVLPQILAGTEAFCAAIIAALVIVPLTFYLAHGVNWKTSSAIIGTMLTLVIVGVVAGISVEASHLTGTGSDEVNVLSQEKPDLINVKDLLMAGIIIGLLGILNDITISQAAIVYKLKEVSPEMKFGRLFSKAMEVGHDHIASVVNTLVLVYAGAALPVLLLFLNNPVPLREILNEEFMAEEILRTLVASIGIVVAVPLTTLITAWMVHKGKHSSHKDSSAVHTHSH